MKITLQAVYWYVLAFTCLANRGQPIYTFLLVLLRDAYPSMLIWVYHSDYELCLSLLKHVCGKKHIPRKIILWEFLKLLYAVSLASPVAIHNKDYWAVPENLQRSLLWIHILPEGVSQQVVSLHITSPNLQWLRTVTIVVEILELRKTKGWWFFDHANHEDMHFCGDELRKTTNHSHSVQLVILTWPR